jgi:hypothetical protein
MGLALILALPGAAAAADPDVPPPPPAPIVPADGWPPAQGDETLTGLPLALRLQKACPLPQRVALALQSAAPAPGAAAFAGAEGRVCWTAARGRQDTLQVNPGVEANITPLPGGWRSCLEPLVAPSVELLWLHDLHGGVRYEVGLELRGQVSLDRGPGADVAPMANVCLGLRY